MTAVKEVPNDYVIRLLSSPSQVAAEQWNTLLARQQQATPFMRHEYLAALHDSGSAVPGTGWTPSFLTLWRGDALQAACACYLKDHSYGEYVFDWAWANAYEQHGLAYYPKALVAVPFTPVPGARLLAVDEPARSTLLKALLKQCRERGLSSLHLLFLTEAEARTCEQAGLMMRHGVQFHWANQDWTDFDGFLSSLSQDKRKKIRQERRRVADAGVSFEAKQGTGIGPADWDFFYRCYERTYLEHGNAPYLRRSFFERMASDMPEHWLMFVAHRGGRPIASSLIALAPESRVAYGRYWGALERVDCLHFEACYYQPLQWCIEQGYASFEGGAQGEHKMARALLPTRTHSAHWLAHPAFADAVQRFLEREGQGIENYLEHLNERSPFRQA
jgi:uncharacterized protein